MKPPLRSLLSLGLPLWLPAVLSSVARAQTTTWAQSYGVGSYDLGTGQPIDDNSYGTGADLPAAIAPMPDGGVVVAGRLGLFKFAINNPRALPDCISCYPGLAR